MTNKRILIYGLLLGIFVFLLYLQFRTWKDFDWATFWSQTHRVHKWHIFHAVTLIYCGYLLRAIRWKIFLKPVRQTSSLKLIAPTLIGFTGLALLGRPGELIRPYLIARREQLPFSSQLAVWAIERIFDIGAFTILWVLASFFATAPKRLSYYGSFREAGIFFSLLVIGLIIGAVAVHYSGESLAAWVEHRFAHRASHWGHRLALRIREFRAGLDTIHDFPSFLLLIAISVLMWATIAVAYKEVTHSYFSETTALLEGRQPLEIPQSQVLLLMGSSMAGSVIQLPGVGGGSQLATIAALEHIFEVPKELAASCGIMLWLVTFVAVVPVGLFLAHREQLSLRELSQQSRKEEEVSAISRPGSP